VNYLRDNSYGVDTEIQKIQTYLYNKINGRFSFTDFDSYGRVYKNKKSGLVIPEYYVSNRDYKEVLLDDRRSGIMFFSTDDSADVNGSLITQDCDLLFSINLASLGVSDDRDDEKIRQIVVSFLRTYNQREDFVKQITTKLEKVYNEFNGVSNYFYDMQDYHHFKIKLGLRYNNINCI
jgi:hypothetical protein